MKPYCHYLTTLLLFIIQQACTAQDSSTAFISKIPARYFDKISKQTASVNNAIDKKSEKLIRRLQRQETKLKRMLSRVDSVNAETLFADAQQKYQQLSDKLITHIPGIGGRMSGEYLAYYDSLKGSLSFLNSNKKFLSSVKSEKLDNTVNEVTKFQDKLQQADAIKEFIKHRKQQLSEALNHYASLPDGITKAMGKYSKELYYYSQSLRTFKETFRDPDKLQRTALTILNKIPVFQQFMKEHSELGGLFNLAGNYGTAEGLVGLQTREQVQQVIANQLGSSVNAGQVFGQQVQAAQSQLDKFKQKLNALGGGDIDMPDFKPNPEKTKTLFQRLEYSANMQSTKSSYFFPSTTDISLMVGYRIDDKKIAGLGIGGKVGWGKDIKHIAVTGQGLNFRSFIDIKIKSSFYASGGFEYNFQKPFYKTQQLYKPDYWTKSGLIGVSKIVSIKSKVFKKTKIQLLWDVLNSLEKAPKISEPIKFRVGYNF